MTVPRFYPILDTATLRARGCDTVAAAAAILDAGAQILQFREKAPFDRQCFEAAERIAGLCRRRSTLFLVNDRADAALLLNAGVHVGQHDLPPCAVRKLIGDLPLGFSTHNQAQFLSAQDEAVDYIAFGPVFGTGSKQNPEPATGLDQLGAMRSLAQRPVVAIGGITRSTARDVLNAGASSVAVIGDLYPPDATPASIAKRTEEWLKLVDQI